jgi:hypothetical protein
VGYSSVAEQLAASQELSSMELEYTTAWQKYAAHNKNVKSLKSDAVITAVTVIRKAYSSTSYHTL